MAKKRKKPRKFSIFYRSRPRSKNNKLTKLTIDDFQSLRFSARQDPYNATRCSQWEKYVTVWGQCVYGPSKRSSDAPELKDAVFKDQEKVVHHQIRKNEQKFKLNVPIPIRAMIVSFYAMEAIYPVPHETRFRPPTKGFHQYELSWKIHWNESKRNWDHPLNEKDRKIREHDQPQSQELEVWGLWEPRDEWHVWHC